jgi:hypothetical protein
MDEYHQSFVPGRHASFADCGIDSIGAALGILAYSANHLRLRTVGLCTTGILPGSTDARTCPDDFGRDVDATIPSGGERRTRQNDRIAPMPGRDDA